MKFNDHWWCFVLFLVAGATVYVHGRGARPTLSQCVISDSENVGIFVTDGAQVGNTCTVMFKPSNFDMTDVKFLKFKNGQSVSTLRNRAQASDGSDCYLPIACVACESSRFSSLLAAWDVSPGETTASQQRNLSRLFQLAYFFKCKRNLEIKSKFSLVAVLLIKPIAIFMFSLPSTPPPTVAFLGSLSNNEGDGYKNVT